MSPIISYEIPWKSNPSSIFTLRQKVRISETGAGMKKLQRIIWAVIILFSPSVVTAAVQMEGYFIAEEACPAYLSIKKKTNI